MSDPPRRGRTGSESSSNGSALWLGVLALALVACNISGTPTAAMSHSRAGGSVADLRMDIIEFQDPEFLGGVFHYGFAAVNDGPDLAEGVEVVDDIPEGLAFARVDVSTSFGEPLEVQIETPEAGQRGLIRISIGAIQPNDWVNTIVYLVATAPPGTVIENTAVVTGFGSDPNFENNDIIVPYRIPYPPVVQFMRAYTTDAGAFRIRLSGYNLLPSSTSAPPFVYIGEEQEVWTEWKATLPLKLILKGGRNGKELKRRFPKGVPIPIRLVNFDGGETTVLFTR